MTTLEKLNEIAHLNLRIIRDNQSPRFESIKETHPEIWEDFNKARGVHHETLKKIRDKRINVLHSVVEGCV